MHASKNKLYGVVEMIILLHKFEKCNDTKQYRWQKSWTWWWHQKLVKSYFMLKN